MTNAATVSPSTSVNAGSAPEAPKRSKRLRQSKTRARAKTKAKGSSVKRGRKVRSFPASTFEEALILAQAIQQFAAGQKVRRLTLFDNLGKAPDSGPSRQLVTNSAKYGLTTGGYQAEHLELTDQGRIASSADIPPAERLKARFELAIARIPPFKELYEHFKGNKLPALPVLRDFLVDKGYDANEVSECVDTFILNAKFLGLLRTIAGAERLLSVEHVLEEIPPNSGIPARAAIEITTRKTVGVPATSDTSDWSKVCFYITPTRRC